jgi:fructosamine-3-kinase
MSPDNIFTKRNTLGFSDALEKEAEGLALLRKQLHNSANEYLLVPEVFSVSETCLELTLIPSCSAGSEHASKLARGLANLHEIKQNCYGCTQDNYIGLNPQINGESNNWGAFFFEKRLMFQVRLISDSSLKKTFLSALYSCKEGLIDFLNAHCTHPSLLHGDLWSGNVLFSMAGGEASVWLIDPAVYYGDREADIAMTRMFGGFDALFYKEYNVCLPLSLVYSEKEVIYNLYHYLNHYNLFGQGYLNACKSGFSFLESYFS